jgi:endoglucanase
MGLRKDFGQAITILLIGSAALAFQNCGKAMTVSEIAPGDSSFSSVNPVSPTPAPEATPTPVAIEKRYFYPGVNLSGGEYSQGKAGAKLYTDYVYPNRDQMKYYASKGMKTVRIPFDANRLQPVRNGALSTQELGYLNDVITIANENKLIVILDPHNYGTLRDELGDEKLLGTVGGMDKSNLADLWSKIAVAMAAKPDVIFGLMNEPYMQTPEEWRVVAEASVKAIRATGSKHKIFVQGTSWTGAHSWISSGNAAAWVGFTDINFAFEIHQYLDIDSSGTHDNCIGGKSETVIKVTEWARLHKFDLFLGEIGWANNTVCSDEGTKLMKYLSANNDVWIGYTYWAAGPWLGEYMFTIEPTGTVAAPVDREQMKILRANFPLNVAP